MSDTQVMGSPQQEQDVQAYISAVRAWLGDLPAEDVEDLTIGMEADLAERVAESGGLLGDLLGQPEAYAAELRAAAGLPPRAAPTAGAPRRRGMAEVSDSVRGVGDSLVLRFSWLRDLRPAWWLVRGAVVAGVFAFVLGGLFFWILIPLGAALSFWRGRRAVGVTHTGAAAGVSVAINAFAVVLLLWGCIVALSSVGTNGGGYEEPEYQPGLSLDGTSVGNLYVYDAQGDRVEGARVYDQEGQGLFIDPNALGFEDVPVRPDGTPDVATDVFPLVIGEQDPWADSGEDWTPPLRLPPLPVLPEGPSPDGESSQPAPDASAPPVVSPSATPTATPPPTPTPPSTPTPTSSGG